jgi:hypothetical protein
MYVNLGGPQHTAEARPSSRYRHLSQHANGEVTTWYVTCGPGQGRPPSRDLVHGTEADFTVGLGIGPPFPSLLPSRANARWRAARFASSALAGPRRQIRGTVSQDVQS